MAVPLNRAQIRDEIRRLVGVIPLTDVSGLASDEGEPTTQQPNPTNALLNQLIRNACSTINLESGFHGASVPLKVLLDAQTADGPLRVPLTTGIGGMDKAFQVDQVRRVWWDDGTNSSNRLTPTSFYDLDIQRVEWQNTAPAKPQRFWTEAQQLYVWPAPDVDGTLFLLAGMGLLPPTNDRDIIEQMPADGYMVITQICAEDLSGIQTQDEVAQARVAFYSAKVQAGIYRIVRMLNMMEPGYMQGVTHRSNRVFPARRR